ncbi:MAG TPA: polyribonucleotide nucleotidyltransferase [Candidatus Saccharimonadales bacterium]|nr:polyribonucleotide nucleotidyltransferase [Candidatus Saccharimonadales bacterium]
MTKTINPFGKKIVKVAGDFCGRELSLETGRFAFQAGAAVTATYGDTVVLATATYANEPRPGMDYFPLSIDYEEKMYAAGKISGSRFIKREGRPTDAAVLAGRLIDRPIRPLFPKGYRNEVQGIVTILSLDPEFKSDCIAMIAMSAALSLTGVPFDGPVGGVRVGLVDGKLVAFPTNTELKDSKLDLVVAGTKDAIMMVEAGAKEVDEETMIKAMELAHNSIKQSVKLQSELVDKVGVKAQEYELVLPNETVQAEVDKYLEGKLGKNLRGSQEERTKKMRELRAETLEHFAAERGEDYDRETYYEAFESTIKKDVREGILKEGIRPDNRKSEEIRPLSSEVGILPRAHGSSIFTRGSTQALNITTLAPLSYAQVIDSMDESSEKRYIHHYNMPGYSVGEVRRVGSPGRREIGHGALAERALIAVIPDEDVFPYTIRAVSEILSSNGSTSMASVCSSTLSLMDAGVPIKAPVSGIAMGLVMDPAKTVILSDISGPEDFAGDMDFKVAGTSGGITALQMDIKVKGLSLDLMRKALAQAKTGRAEILDHLISTLDKYRAELSPYAPRVKTIKVNPDKIREIIGKGGETINKIIAGTGAEIDIKDDGSVFISSPDKQSIDAAIEWIQTITAEPEVGKVYTNCRVVSVLEFGIFVEIMPGKEGLVHVSEMKHERVNRPSDIAKEGDHVDVKLVAIDDRGRLNLSMKVLEDNKKS